MKTKPSSNDDTFFVTEFDNQIKHLQWLVSVARESQQTFLIAFLQSAIRSLEYARNRARASVEKRKKKASKG